MNDLTPDETEAIDWSSSQEAHAVAFGHLRRSLPSGSILTLCLMAAFADGEKQEREREQIRKIAESFRPSEVDLAALYQEVLLRKPESAALS